MLKTELEVEFGIDEDVCNWFNNEPFKPEIGVILPKCLDCDTLDDRREFPVTFGCIAALVEFPIV